MSYEGYDLGLFRYGDYDKLPEEYLKDVETKKINEDDLVDREVGRLDYMKMPKDLLLDVMDKAFLSSQHTEDLEQYKDELYQYLNMGLSDVLSLFKDFLGLIDDDKVYNSFVHILDLTTQMIYICKDPAFINEISDAEETDQDKVGAYYFLVKRPIPFELINRLKKEIAEVKQRAFEDGVAKASKGYFDEEIDEYSKDL